jgi:hypothetical protein
VTFLALGIDAAERRFYVSKIFEVTRIRVVLPPASESA